MDPDLSSSHETDPEDREDGGGGKRQKTTPATAPASAVKNLSRFNTSGRSTPTQYSRGGIVGSGVKEQKRILCDNCGSEEHRTKSCPHKEQDSESEDDEN